MDWCSDLCSSSLAPEAGEVSWPWMAMLPVSTASNPASTRSRVVLPAPLSPCTSSASPAATSKSSGPNTRVSLRANDRSRTESRDGSAGLVLGMQRSEEHTAELQSLMRISYAVLCLKKQNTTPIFISTHYQIDKR